MKQFKKAGIILIAAGILLWPAVITFILGFKWLRNDELRVVNYLLCLFLLVTGFVLVIDSGSKKTIKGYFKIVFALVATLLLLVLTDHIYCRLTSGRGSGPSYQVYYKGDNYADDSVLGFKAGESITKNALSISYPDLDTLYDVYYHSDGFSRRITFGSEDTSRKKYLIFFGCSYIWGWGVEDNETLPSYMAQNCSEYKCYNYSFIAYGPQHMLARLETNTTRSEVPEKDGMAIFVLIPNHVNRAIGDMLTFNGIGRTMPNYEYDRNDKLMRNGNFTNRTWTNKIYRLLSYSCMVRRMRINFPPTIRRKHLELTADIMVSSKKLYQQQFGNDNFYVLIYPAVKYDYTLLDSLKVVLKERKLQVLDYSDFFGGDVDSFIIKPLLDSHPNALSNERIAQKLKEELCF